MSGKTNYFLDRYKKLAREYKVKHGSWEAKKMAREHILLAALNSAESWEDIRDCMIFMVNDDVYSTNRSTTLRSHLVALRGRGL